MERKQIIIQKIVAMLIVFVMSMVQCSVLGTTALSYAVDMLVTNSDNVEFKAYFEKDGIEMSEFESVLDNKDIKLNVDISVKNEGYFNGQISLDNSNFKVKEKQESNYISKVENGVIYLNQINAEESAKIKIDIEFVNEDKVDADWATKETNVKLYGIYYNSKKDIEINGENKVKIKLKASGSEKSEIASLLLTNKTYETVNTDNQKTNKKVVQFMVRSKITNNAYPVKETQIEAKVPQNVQNVMVHKRTTNATNGDKEFTNANYRVQEGKLIINVKNDELNGKIAWAKNTHDIYVITYEYKENVEDTTNSIDIIGKTVLNDEKRTVLNSEKQVIDLTKEKEELASMEIIQNEKEMYKGKIYTGEEREYKTTNKIFVNYAKEIENLKIALDEIKYKSITNNETKEGMEVNSNITYKSIIFNKQNIEKVLGQEWNITLINSENKEIVISNVSEFDEKGNIEIGVNSKRLFLVTSKVQSNEKLEFNVVKLIQNEYERSQIQNISEIKEKNTLTYTKKDGTYTEINKVSSIKLKETVSKASLNLSKPNLLAKSNNEDIELVAKLESNGEDTNLYKNPQMEIIFPKEISDIKVKQASALYKNGLILEENKKYKTEDGRIALYVGFKGEQEKYDVLKGLEVHLYLDISVENTQQDLIKNIEMIYKNEFDNSENTTMQNINVIANSFENRINSVDNNVDENKVEEIEKNQVEEKNVDEKESEGKLQESNNKGLTAIIDTYRGTDKINKNDSIYEGETIKNVITLKNDSEKDFFNLTVKAVQTNGLMWKNVERIDEVEEDDKTNEHLYRLDNSNELEFEKIDTLKSGETVELQYETTISEGEKTSGAIEVKSTEAGINESFKTEEYKIKKAEIQLNLIDINSVEKIWQSDKIMCSELVIANLTEQELNNIEVKVTFSKHLSCDTEAFYEEENENVVLVNKEQNENGETVATFNVLKLKAKGSTTIEMIFKGKDINQNEQVYVIAQAKTQSGEKYCSNVINRLVYVPKFDVGIEQKIYKDNEEIKDTLSVNGDEYIDFDIKVINNEDKKLELSVVNSLPKNILINSVYEVKDNNEINITSDVVEDEILKEIPITVNAKSSINIRIKTLRLGTSGNETIENNVALKTNGQTELATSKLKINVVNNIENNSENIPNEEIENQNSENQPKEETGNKNSETEKNPNDGNSNTNKSEKSDNKKEQYTVSGKVWIDKNKNGKIDGSENGVPDIDVKVVDATKGILNENSAKTTSDGNYKLQLIPGNYMIIFMYDTTKYGITTYQVGSESDTSNSKAVTKILKMEEKEETIGATDVININGNVSNINCGFIEKENFDMKIEKYVSKVTITNKEGIKTKNFDISNTLPKVEIRSKYLENSVVLIEYTIKLTNVGEIDGYVTKIKDIIPASLKYQSNLNNDWYEKNNILYNESLSNEKIKVGESKELKLILTKTMTESNTGLVKNTVSIESMKNENLVEDNKKDNNESYANVIITVSTGEKGILVLGSIVFGILAITGTGILITKRQEVK